MKKYSVAVLGATGEVGRQMIKVLEEHEFPVSELRLLASARSVGKTVCFNGKDIPVYEAKEDSFNGIDIVFGAASASLARKFAPFIKEAGAVFVDNSSAFRHDTDVPLVVPEINGDDVKWNKGIIANPNCSTIITLMAVKGINRLSKIEKMVASTYQAVSGAGAGGLRELKDQNSALAEGREIVCDTFPYQISENLIPAIGSFTDNGYSTEEMKMQNEGRKIMHLPDLKVTCTCVRVPVMRSHSISVSVYTEDELDLDAVRAQIAKEDGVRLVDDPANRIYPMPLDTSDQDLVYVGRIRKDLAFEKGITLWCCGDQIRKGAATNAVQIAELLIER